MGTQWLGCDFSVLKKYIGALFDRASMTITNKLGMCLELRPVKRYDSGVAGWALDNILILSETLG